MHALVWPSVLVWAVICVSAHTCLSGEFECLTGECVSEKYVCDFNQDCLDGSDEGNCKYETTLISFSFRINSFCFDVLILIL